jgi:hypothetical protein
MSPPDGHFQITALVAPTISSTVTGQETPTFDYLELRQITETTTLDVEMEKKIPKEVRCSFLLNGRVCSQASLQEHWLVEWEGSVS